MAFENYESRTLGLYSAFLAFSRMRRRSMAWPTLTVATTFWIVGLRILGLWMTQPRFIVKVLGRRNNWGETKGRRFPVQRRCEKTLKRRRKKKTNWGRKKKRRFLFPKGKQRTKGKSEINNSTASIERRRNKITHTHK